jgi:hypothetical protein
MNCFKRTLKKVKLESIKLAEGYKLKSSPPFLSKVKQIKIINCVLKWLLSRNNFFAIRNLAEAVLPRNWDFPFDPKQETQAQQNVLTNLRLKRRTKTNLNWQKWEQSVYENEMKTFEGKNLLKVVYETRITRLALF